MQKPNELLSQKDKDDMKSFIRMTMKQRRALNISVTVKAHVLESHLNDQIEYYSSYRIKTKIGKMHIWRGKFERRKKKCKERETA